MHSFSAVNSFDRPPHLGAVGPVVYALNKLLPLSSFVISSFIVDSRGEVGSCSLLHHGSDLHWDLLRV